MFVEQVIGDNLDIGRPEHVGLIFDRRIIRRERHALLQPCSSTDC